MPLFVLEILKMCYNIIQRGGERNLIIKVILMKTSALSNYKPMDIVSGLQNKPIQYAVFILAATPLAISLLKFTDRQIDRAMANSYSVQVSIGSNGLSLHCDPKATVQQ